MEDVPTSCLSTLSAWVPMAGPCPAPQAMQAITHYTQSQGKEGVWERAHLGWVVGGGWEKSLAHAGLGMGIMDHKKLVVQWESQNQDLDKGLESKVKTE